MPGIENIQNDLFALQDLKYRDFQCKLMPSVAPEAVIGVRTPELRKYAKSIAKSEQAVAFLAVLPHKYYEENNLHCFLIEQIKDFDDCVRKINKFLPYVDNWSTCDTMRPKCFAKNPEKLLKEVDKWLCSSHTYTIRFGIGMLMSFYLDDKFEERFLKKVAEIESEEYYVNMMIAWYFATALAKQWESTIVYLEKKRLPQWVHNKTIQKAVESYRITDDQKIYLREMRRK